MLQNLLRLRTNSTAAAVLSPKPSQDSFDDDFDVFSTPPSTPTMSSASSSFSELSSAGASHPDSSGASSRRNSRPTSLLIDSDRAQEWAPDVQLDNIESPNVGKGAIGHGAQTVQSSQGAELLSHSATSQQPQTLHNSTQASAGSAQPVSSSGMYTQSGSSNKFGEMSNASVNAIGVSSSGSDTYTQRENLHGLQPSQGHLEASQAHSHTHHLSHSHQSQQQPAAAYQPKSPCFVHSHLDKGVSLTDWLKLGKSGMGFLGDSNGSGTVGVAKGLQNGPDASPSTAKHPTFHHKPHPPPKSIGQPVFTNHQRLPSSEMGFAYGSSPGSSPSDFDEEEDNAGNLTRQLAETAVGVREMSKQLGRARVRSNIQSVLIITKARDNRLIKLTRELALYLMAKHRNGGRGLVVYVDNQLRYSKRFDAEGIKKEHPEFFVPFPRRRSSSSNSLSSMTSSNNGSDYSMQEEGQLRYWTSDMCNRYPHLFDFVVTLGGDGTVLFTSWLFQRIVPPVLPFALGSLGFLTNFDFADYAAVMDSAIENGIRVNLRMRFTCTVYRAIAPEPGKGRRAVKKADTGEILMKNLEEGGWEALEGGWSANDAVKDGKKSKKDKEIMCFSTRPVESFEVLNDLVVDRGPSPYMSLLELFGDEHHMTTVQADGLTISTPTGSTAYSLSAGGSLVHPEIPAILISPICPHTLSFRPMLLPDSMELRICVPYNSRSTAWASFDGRGRVELKQGDHIKVTASKYPFPTVCADKQSTDWFHAISRTLKWNERERQKSFVVVEEGPARPKKDNKKQAADEDDEEEDEVSDEDEEEEEEKFDIDDSSTAAASAVPSSTDLVAMQKAHEEGDREARVAAMAIKGNSVFSAAQSHDGIETPDRFVGAHPHPPRLSPRHVSWNSNGVPPVPHIHNIPATAASSAESLVLGHAAERGDRDHIHTPQLLSGGRSRIPRDRDVEAESMNVKTPTAADAPMMHRSTSAAIAGGAAGTHGAGVAASGKKSHVRGSSRDDCFARRAFAVWGQDESDSAASDNDS